LTDALAGDGVAPDLSGLLRDADEGFGRATSAIGEVVQHFVIAGHSFRIRIAGKALAGTLLPALARCRREPASAGEPVKEFRAWDSVGSGITPPPAPWSIDDYLPRDEVRGSGDRGIDASYALADRILSLWCGAEGRGRFWVNDAEALPAWESSAPFRNLLHWALADEGLAFAHAGVVGTAAGGVLLAGRGGAGKSTTAMVCVDAGWKYVSDDYCVLDATGTDPTAHALYGTAKIAPSALARLPGLAQMERSQRDDGKIVLAVGTSAPALLAASLPLRALVIPTVAAATGSLHRLPLAAGARALAPSTLFQLPGARQGSLGTIAAILRSVPVFGLEVGPDFGAIPEALLPAVEGRAT
jgi:hypothetical protein